MPPPREREHLPSVFGGVNDPGHCGTKSHSTHVHRPSDNPIGGNNCSKPSIHDGTTTLLIRLEAAEKRPQHWVRLN